MSTIGIIQATERNGKVMPGIISMFNVPSTVSTRYYESVDCFSREGIWQLCYRDLANHGFEIDSLSELSELCFNTKTIFPNDWQSQADMVLQDGKTNLLNCGTLTGNGIKVAVIDRPINKNHIELKSRIEYIEICPNHPETKTIDFHGMACASFLSGSTCGVATESQLVYFAIPNKTHPIEEYYNNQLIALQKVIDYNRTSTDPIRIVSLSAPFTKEQKPFRDSLAYELEQTGCALIDATIFGRNFAGVDYIRHQENGSYILNKWQLDNFERNKSRNSFLEYLNKLCFVPSSRRTSASNDSDYDYIHWSKAVSESWTIPHVAGAYALCLQVYPSMTFEDFVTLSKLSAKYSGLTILDVQSIIDNNIYSLESKNRYK